MLTTDRLTPSVGRKQLLLNFNFAPSSNRGQNKEHDCDSASLIHRCNINATISKRVNQFAVATACSCSAISFVLPWLFLEKDAQQFRKNEFS
mmetsp:Transcript_39548/g.95086  ORF Transcript_39548/g.95086 Transcript_39548/m.95086 type:complete len:92 (+) Transcript_39548:301-576(+)